MGLRDRTVKLIKVGIDPNSTDYSQTAWRLSCKKCRTFGLQQPPKVDFQPRKSSSRDRAHSLAEVGLGLMIGIVSLALFGQKYVQAPDTKVWPLLIAAGVLISVLHGSQLHAEELLHRITGYVPLHCG